ncbi:ionotropic receptor 75a [Bicyclus anynana]|uniref:Ionotropic receptor 75a n=1 Tax=Bicyclus anynana TaxID=110368 RepID=A0A6J1N549_BICAN|nr:ionotropic receptor 75a [Bicyclus anynana]
MCPVCTMEKAGLVTFFLLFGVVFSDITTEVNLISNILTSTEKPSSVVAITCWPSYKKVQLYSTLAAKNMIEFIEPGDISKNLEQMHHVVFVADLSCPNTLKSIKMFNEEKMFAAPFRWILIGLNASDSEKEIILPEVFDNVNFLVDSEIILLQRLHDMSYAIYYVYKIRAENSWKTESYGFWNGSQGFQESDDFIKITALRRRNLEKYEITICYVLTDYDSINHLTDEVNDHIDTITKVNFPTTNQLLDFLNAGRKYIFTDTWGYRRNNSWSGMTGYLVREEVEIGGSPMFFTSERLSVVEYISSPTPTRSKFVFQQPKLSYENNLFLLSFKFSLWVGSSVLILLVYLVLCIVAFWEWRQSRHRVSRINDAGILRPNLIDVGMFIFGTTCQQGSTVELKGSLGRMVLIFLFVAVTFLYTSYSANIVALLQSSSSQIKTLEDLLHSRIKFGVHDTVFNRYYFTTETEPVRRAIYETKVAPPGTTPRFMTMENGVREIQKGLFAFHMETGVGYKFVGKYFEEGEKCGLKEIQYLRVIDPWLAVRKNTPFMEMFKIGTKRLQEHGLQQRENHLLYEKRPRCSGRQANFVSVSMVDCYPALLILSYGALIALIIALLEILYHRRYEIVHKFEHGASHRFN